MKNLSEGNLEPAIVITLVLLGILVAITSYAVFNAFGSGASKLRDPFEEHEE